ncbi:long-chain acyl-CoA synthetase [Nakamurella sp. UYEF19]|uniref:class I adenylate-forming enzyme family protein n=1 Tax=Nakamurella sp. UYEF19 TaxID=1756392 RepID=UPI003396BEE5
MTSATTGRNGLPGNVSDLLRSAAAGFPERPALIFSGGVRSWAELDRAADVGAHALLAGGLVACDRVIVSLRTGPDIIAALFAVVRAGLVAVPIGPGRQDLAAVVRKVTARGAIAVQSDVPVEVAVEPDAVAAWWQAAVPPGPLRPTGGEDLAVLARAASSEHPVMLSHRAILAAVAAIVAAPRLRLRADDRAILVLPTYHLAGWVTAFLPLCAVGGAAVVPDPPSDRTSWVEAVLTTIRSQRVTVVPGAPSLYRRLRTAAGVERALASVRLMTSGAAPLDPGDSSAIRALVGQGVWEGYGISESASVVSTGLMATAARTGSVGLPVSGLTLRIVGDDGVDLYAEPGDDPARPITPPGEDDPGAGAADGGEVGRIQIGGPTLFSGYWPDGSGGPDDDGWFTTGDLGYLDDIGELHLVDRATETIRIAGFTVYPREIEDVLMGHPYVRDAAVIGAPGKAGDAVVAILVPLRGTRPTPSDLEEFVAARLPVFKRPRSYRLVDRLPRNEIGRIDRDAVRALYRDGDPWESDPAADRKAEEAARVLAEAPDGPDAGEDAAPAGVPAAAGVPSAAGGPAVSGAVTAPDVRPERAAAIEELGTRLPGTGERQRRGDEDTDDDLF